MTLRIRLWKKHMSCNFYIYENCIKSREVTEPNVFVWPTRAKRKRSTRFSWSWRCQFVPNRGCPSYPRCPWPPTFPYVLKFWIRSITKAPEVVKSHQRSRFSELLLAITNERSRIQEWVWCHSDEHVTRIRMICNITLKGKNVTLTLGRSISQKGHVAYR